MTSLVISDGDSIGGNNEHLFETIAENIREDGYCIHLNALPSELGKALQQQVLGMSGEQFKQAGIGRDQRHTVDDLVRTDEVCWISEDSEAGRAWLSWTAELQSFLNRRLFLGLFSFESHFAHYAPGDFYKMHLDAFKGESNRVLSLVVYLNLDWQPEDGGELVIQSGESTQDLVKVTPAFGTVVVFLSEEFPHEVLPASRDRYSIAGWFRLNASSTERIDPPS